MGSWSDRPESLLTNMESKKRGIAEKTISERPDDGVYIVEKAYDNLHRDLGPEYFALHCYYRKDLSDFWRAFRKNEKEMTNG